MPAPNYTNTVADINDSLKSSPPAAPRSINAAVLRSLLLRFAAWSSEVYDACSQFASFYAANGIMTSNRVVNLNGKTLDFNNGGPVTVSGAEILTRANVRQGLTTAASTTNPIATQPVDNIAGVQVLSAGTGAGPAFMAFQRVGYDGMYFGLDTDNNLRCRPWSGGSVSYKVYHEGNFNAANYRLVSQPVPFSMISLLPGFLADASLSVLLQDQPMWSAGMKSGFYHVYQSANNSVSGQPFSAQANQTCVLINMALSTNNQYAVQLAVDINSDQMKFRRIVNGSAQAWRSINIT